MYFWVFRRGEWESPPMPEEPPPASLGLSRAAQTLTPDGAVRLYAGRGGSEFRYGIQLRIGTPAEGREEWICVPDLPSLLGLMQLLGPWLRSEVTLESYLAAMLDERLGPPADKPVSTGSTRGLTAMSQVLFSDADIAADLQELLDELPDNSRRAGGSLESVLHRMTTLRGQISTEGDPNAVRCDAVIALLQSASLLLQSGERASAIEEIRKAIATWKMDGEPLLP